MHLRIGKKVQLQNGNNSKCKMKNRNKSPIKVELFWEGHKNVRNRPYGFDVY